MWPVAGSSRGDVVSSEQSEESDSVVVSESGRCRQLGDLPWASAWMRCFIVGGRALSSDQDQRGVVGAGADAFGVLLSLLRVSSLCGTAAEAVVEAVVVMSPSAVHSARKAVTTAFHSFMTLFRAMAPHFRVGRFAYFPHDVYEVREVVDRRPWRVDVQMNTTRMGA
jgi:hypothetical protein